MAILYVVEAVEDDLSKSYDLTDEDKVSASLSDQENSMEAVEVTRSARYVLVIVKTLDEGVNE